MFPRTYGVSWLALLGSLGAGRPETTTGLARRFDRSNTVVAATTAVTERPAITPRLIEDDMMYEKV